MSEHPDIRLMVVDSVGGQRFSDRYRNYFARVTLEGYEPDDYGKCSPHGYQVGYWAGALLSLYPGKASITYVRVFDGQSRWIPASSEYVLRMIREKRPTHVTGSWGQWDGDTRMGEFNISSGWRDWSDRYRELQQEIGFITAAAAGNHDRNDEDDDVNGPWRLLTDCVTIIGSARRDGVPSVWSGDGHVDAVAWGEQVPLLGYNTWGWGSGTSFAAPAALSLCMAEGIFELAAWRSYIAENTTVPRGYRGLIPHRKWGQGNLTHRLMEHRSMLPEQLLPPRSRPPRIQQYEDFKHIAQEA